MEWKNESKTILSTRSFSIVFLHIFSVRMNILHLTLECKKSERLKLAKNDPKTNQQRPLLNALGGDHKKDTIVANCNV